MIRELTIRQATGADAKRLCELASQLGYLCHPSEVVGRIERVAGSDKEVILVAQSEDEVIGWTSLAIVEHFYLEPFVEVSGFVVDERFRSHGIGKQLMAAAEQWVRDKNLNLIRLKTNAIRKGAHRFYERHGFEKTKEQYVYMKIIE